MPQSLRVISSAGTAIAGLLPLALGTVSAQAPPPTAATAPASAAVSGAQATGGTAKPAAAVDMPFTRGKVDAGATKITVCSACHGPNGNSVNPEWPRLAGQSAVYIAEQLRLFRSGVRDNPVMKPLAGGLSNQDIDDIAVYYEAQTPVGLEADPADSKAGRALYVRGEAATGVPSCAACHGPLGRGNLAAGYPALRAQQAVYVVKQLNDYASGARYSGPNPATASRNGVMMFTIAKRLTAEQIRDVAAYVQGLR